MRFLFVHNDYARRSGEEFAVESLADLLESHGHRVDWFRRCSDEIVGSMYGSAKAFLCGIHNPSAIRALETILDETSPDIVQFQNLYPLLSPSVVQSASRRGIPTVMRCPNYRLFCPTGLLLSRGRCTQQGGARCDEGGTEHAFSLVLRL